jgi:hypothetical protein
MNSDPVAPELQQLVVFEETTEDLSSTEEVDSFQILLDHTFVGHLIGKCRLSELKRSNACLSMIQACITFLKDEKIVNDIVIDTRENLYQVEANDKIWSIDMTSPAETIVDKRANTTKNPSKSSILVTRSYYPQQEKYKGSCDRACCSRNASDNCPKCLKAFCFQHLGITYHACPCLQRN